MSRRTVLKLAGVVAGVGLTAVAGWFWWDATAVDDEASAGGSTTTTQPPTTTTTLPIVDEFDVATIGHVQCRGTQVYVVQRGDGLLGIVDNDAVVLLGEGLRDGEGFVTVVRRVAAANQVADVDQIQAGQELTLPVQCDITAPATGPTGPTTTTSLPPDFLFSFDLENGIAYCYGPVTQFTLGGQTNFFFLVEREVGFRPPLDQGQSPELMVAAIAQELNQVGDWNDLEAGSPVNVPEGCGPLP